MVEAAIVEAVLDRAVRPQIGEALMGYVVRLTALTLALTGGDCEEAG